MCLAIEQDKQRWFTAWKLLRGKTRQDIRRWLADQDDEYRHDMKRRLNEIVKNKKEGKWKIVRLQKSC